MAAGIDQAMNTPGVLLLGASSQIGVFAIPRLLRAGFRVLAVSRRGRPEGYPVFERVEWLDEADAVVASQSCQYMLSAGPMELAKKFLSTYQKHASPHTSIVTPGLTRGPFHTAVVFSSSSVETKQESANPLERSQVQYMLKLESEIQLTAQSRGTQLVIFRPTLIYGCGLDTNITRLAGWIRRFGFMPLNGKANGIRQPVHADDLASAAINAMLNTDALPPMFSLTGGDTLSYSEMVSRIFSALGKPARLVRLPEWLFALLISFAGVLKIAGGLNKEMVRRQCEDLVFDDQQARELLNYKPRPFFPVEADFSLPDFEKLRGD